jgi:hypothetical protein
VVWEGEGREAFPYPDYRNGGSRPRTCNDYDAQINFPGARRIEAREEEPDEIFVMTCYDIR